GIDLFLGCRACETVCPTNVRYGDILMSAVEVLKENKDMGVIEKVNRTVAFKFALKNKNVLRIINKGLYAYQISGMQKVVKNYNLLKPVKNINPFRRNDLSIGFFQGCIMDSFFANINELAIKIMKKHYVQVTNIPKQGCCGALQYHAGETAQTVELAMKNIAAYEKYDFDYIVNTIGGCGATLKEYDKLFEPGTDWHKRAVEFTNKVRDISQIMALID